MSKIVVKFEESEGRTLYFVDGVRCKPSGSIGDFVQWASSRDIRRKSETKMKDGVTTHTVKLNPGEDFIDEFREQWAVPDTAPLPIVAEIIDPVTRSCLAKRRYETKDDADTARARTMADRRYRNEANRRFITYRCVHCQGWHIGHDRSQKEYSEEMSW